MVLAVGGCLILQTVSQICLVKIIDFLQCMDRRLDVILIRVYGSAVHDKIIHPVGFGENNTVPVKDLAAAVEIVWLS